MPAEDVFIVPGAIECDCGTCTGLHHTRAALFNVSLEHLATIEGEGELVNKVITSDRLLAQVQEAVNRVHNPHLYGIKAGQPGPQGRELLKGLQAGGNNNGLLFVDSNGSPSKDGDQTPRAKRMVTNPFGAPGTPSPPKEGKSKTFQTLVRARAAELGILRERDDVESDIPPPPTNIRKTTSPIKDKSKFIVCDHCRSHGIQCNEASVCKECIMREVPCTHRQCDLSPQSREKCPRQVCFYVHGDWMPDIYGKHNPKDVNWLILPGKVREHLSAGKLGKLPHKDEAEVRQCYRGVTARQQDAVKSMAECVAAGFGTWESVAMKCACVEIEREEQLTRAAEENLRRMGLEQ